MAKSSRTTAREPREPAPRGAASAARGKIQRIYVERGFGFIKCTDGKPDDIGSDFFFHTSGLLDCRIEDLMEGSLVTFEPTYVPKGKRAEHIQLDGA